MNPLLIRRRGMMTNMALPTSLIIYPSSYESTNTVTNPSNAYTPATSNTYASAVGSVVFYFDLSALPNNITITSANISVKFRNGGSGRNFDLRTGGTTVIQQTTNTSDTTLNFDVTNWSNAELRNINFRVRNTTSATIRVYGATLSIDFEYI